MLIVVCELSFTRWDSGCKAARLWPIIEIVEINSEIAIIQPLMDFPISFAKQSTALTSLLSSVLMLKSLHPNEDWCLTTEQSKHFNQPPRSLKFSIIELTVTERDRRNVLQNRSRIHIATTCRWSTRNPFLCFTVTNQTKPISTQRCIRDVLARVVEWQRVRLKHFYV